MIKNSDCIVIASADNTSVVELHARNAFFMPRQSLLACTAVDVPDLDETVSRRRDDLIIVHLYRINGCPVSIQRHQKRVRPQASDVVFGKLCF
jgi:hypothetical protein